MAETKTAISVRVPPELVEQLDGCREPGQTRTDVIVAALEAYAKRGRVAGSRARGAATPAKAKARAVPARRLTAAQKRAAAAVSPRLAKRDATVAVQRAVVSVARDPGKHLANCHCPVCEPKRAA